MFTAAKSEKVHVAGRECRLLYTNAGVRITCDHFLVEVPRDGTGPFKEAEKKRLRVEAIKRMSKLLAKKGSKRRR